MTPWIDFFSGLACGMCLVAVIAFRLLAIAKHEMTMREKEIMDLTSELAKERALPKKRPRGTPHWPHPRGQA